VKGAAAAERRQCQFEVRVGRTVEEHHGSQAGAEGDDQFEPFATDHSEPVHVGVVCEPSRLPEPSLELSGEREPCPRFGQLA